jgi:hypothetical protein
MLQGRRLGHQASRATMERNARGYILYTIFPFLKIHFTIKLIILWLSFFWQLHHQEPGDT